MIRCLFLPLFLVSNFILLVPQASQSQSRSNILNPASDPRGEPEVTVCSQNLQNYGDFKLVVAREHSMTEAKLSEKEDMLAERFAKAKCDVIAVQEVLARESDKAKEALQRLANRIRQKNNRFFEVYPAPSNDPVSRVGFLVAKDRAEVMNVVSFSKVELPKLIDKDKVRLFSRGPFELQLRVKPLKGGPSKTLTVITFHFKSKRGGEGDPTGLDWETYRMEMAEALRRLIDARHKNSFGSGETLLVVLGDRNSNFDSASAKILEGILTLNSFKNKAPCRLSKRGVPLCQAGNAQPQRLFSVLTSDPETGNLEGTHKFKKVYSWLDDVLLPAESLRYAWATFESPGDYDSGVIYEPKKASDHALVYVRLNW